MKFYKIYIEGMIDQVYLSMTEVTDYLVWYIQENQADYGIFNSRKSILNHLDEYKNMYKIEIKEEAIK